MDFEPSPIDPLLPFSPVRVSFNTGKAVRQKLGYLTSQSMHTKTLNVLIARSGVEIKLLLESHYGGSSGVRAGLKSSGRGSGYVVYNLDGMSLLNSMDADTVVPSWLMDLYVVKPRLQRF